MEPQSITTAVAHTNNNNKLTPSPSSNSTPSSTVIMVDYAAELLLLKNDIQALQTMLTDTVEQIKNEIVSFHTILVSSTMETDAAHSADTNHHHQSPLDLPSHHHFQPQT